MSYLIQNSSLTRRAFWLVKLRWIAVVASAGATSVAHQVMGVNLPSGRLYTISTLLLIYNITVYCLLRRIRQREEDRERTIEAVITGQIVADLMILTTMLHYSGGIENPFYSFFVFHMIIASILTSRRQSLIHATLAMLIFGGIVVLEAKDILPHYALTGFTLAVPYQNFTYIVGTLGVLAVTLYLVVYMTTSIATQLRLQKSGLTEANDSLKEKDEIKNQYVLRVTHDIKGHLAAIESCLRLVVDGTTGTLNAQQKNLAGRAYRRTNRCLEFVLALLRVTRMKLAGQREVTGFSLRTCIAAAIGAVERSAKDKNITLHFDLDKCIDQYYGEAVLIEETITNLLANAVKYTPNGGQVNMTVCDLPDFIEVRIQDTGIGIPENERPQVFEEFFRAKNARNIERNGTGLGLSFAKQVIERHGGTIDVQSRENQGSTFTFTLSK